MNSCTTCVATSPQIRVALYLRVSTKDKGQETFNQANQLREFCKTQGWIIVCVYEDHDSGGKADRAQFQAMMSDAAQRRFDVLVFWALDRLTREGALETLQYLNRLSSYGVGFRSFTEPYLDSCGIFKDAVIAILGTIAKTRASSDIGARSRRAGSCQVARDQEWKAHWSAQGSVRAQPSPRTTSSRLVLAQDRPYAWCQRGDRAPGLSRSEGDLIGMPKPSVSF